MMSSKIRWANAHVYDVELSKHHGKVTYRDFPVCVLGMAMENTDDGIIPVFICELADGSVCNIYTECITFDKPMKRKE